MTVAAVVVQNGRFLLVEEHTDEGIRLNQPAGHLELGESLLQASIREAREETGYPFTPTHLVGIYQWVRPQGDITYLRFAFGGDVGEAIAGAQLDEGILRPVWMTPAEIEASRARHRSPLVWQCVQDALAGQRVPLALIRHYDP